MPIEWSGLAPELLLALDRHSGDPLHSQLEGRLRGGDPVRRRVTLRDEPGAANGLVDRLSLILHPSLAGGSGAGTYPRDGAIRPLSLRAGSVTAEGAVLLDYRLG